MLVQLNVDYWMTYIEAKSTNSTCALFIWSAGHSAFSHQCTCRKNHFLSYQKSYFFLFGLIRTQALILMYHQLSFHYETTEFYGDDNPTQMGLA